MLKLVERMGERPEFAALTEYLRAGGDVSAGGLWGSSFAPLVVALAGKLGEPLVLVCANVEEYEGAAEDLRTFDESLVDAFPAWESLPGPDNPPDSHILRARLPILRRLLEDGSAAKGRILLVPVQALLQPVMGPAALARNTLVLTHKQEIAPETICTWLTDRGFQSADGVELPGQFSRRGGILDVFGLGETSACRVEFFGDQIESIRRFDAETQVSDRDVDSVRLVALGGDVLTGEQDIAGSVNLLDYLPQSAVVVFKEPVDVQQRARQYLDTMGLREGLYTYEGMFQSSGRFRRLFLSAFAEFHSERTVSFRVEMLPEFPTGLDKIAERLGELVEQLSRVIVVCNNEAEAMRLRELLSGLGQERLGRLEVQFGRINRGFIDTTLNCAVVGHQEIFHRYAVRRPLRKVLKGRTLEAFLELDRGDVVVHTVHGIGRFLGTEILERDGSEEEFLVLEFADRVKVFVPGSRIDQVQKYIGGFEGEPTLSKVGGTQWEARKAQVIEAVRELAREMLRIQAVRRTQPGISFPADDLFQKEFEAEFPYQETEDQLQVLDEIKRDMVAQRPMDRLICGDVGYGKTELAIRAAFKGAMAGYQVAVLVPTTVLAQQHFTTFGERMADYPIVIEMLSRFKTRAEQLEVINRLAAGQVDILIGTHRLLQADVKFARLGLVVIDEEQRFGVKHKEHFKRLRHHVDVLTLTATPIPRTLHMSLLGIREISSLETPPMDRQAIYTEIGHWDPRLIRRAVLRECARDGQIFFVHNRIYNIHGVADVIRQMVPEARVSVAHGQMHEHELEARMREFVHGQVDVLVTTTIIENGLDIPNANTIFINEAENFGLADLHQLRGRVGRYKYHAYAYFLLGDKAPLSSTAAKRLKAIKDYAELGAGFHIAMRDLEIRGAGNILGSEQSGHIAAIGYDLYCKLMERAVKELKHEPIEEPPDFHIHVGLRGYVPNGYVRSEPERIEIYRRLAAARNLAELELLSKEFVDRFGPYPEQVQQLLDRQELRLLAAPHGVTGVMRWEDRLVFTFADAGKVASLMEPLKDRIRMPDERTVHLLAPPSMLTNVQTLTGYLRALFTGALKIKLRVPRRAGARR